MSRILSVIIIYKKYKIMKYRVLDPIKFSTYCNCVSLYYKYVLNGKVDTPNVRLSDTTFCHFSGIGI